MYFFLMGTHFIIEENYSNNITSNIFNDAHQSFTKWSVRLTTRITGASFFMYRVAGAGQVLSIALTSPSYLLYSVWYSPEMECDVFHAYFII